MVHQGPGGSEATPDAAGNRLHAPGNRAPVDDHQEIHRGRRAGQRSRSLHPIHQIFDQAPSLGKIRGSRRQLLSFLDDRPGGCHRRNCKVTDRSMQFLQGHDGRFECMLDTLQTLPIPRVDAEQVRRWFGEVKKFPNIDLLVQIISEGAPVAVTEKRDLRAATEYWNHNSARR